MLHKVIEVDIHGASSRDYRDRNVLSLGYRSQRWHSGLQIKDSIGIECYFVNTLHSFFMNSNWELALSRMGDLVMGHILTRPVLQPYKTSYIQVPRDMIISHALPLCHHSIFFRFLVQRCPTICNDTTPDC